MKILDQAEIFINYISKEILSINLVLLFLVFIILSQIILFLLRDRNYIRAIKKYKDPEVISIDRLKKLPLINIIIPAWQEGKEFYDCLLSITKLTYPHLKVIVNAGGNEETIQIAESFKKFESFTILRQTEGRHKAALGKIKALNECLDYVSEGILYLIDADCYLTDEILLRMIFPIINENEKVVVGGGIRPLKSQEQFSLARYLEFNRNIFFRIKFNRYIPNLVGGAITCMTYDVIRTIGKFNENRKFAEDISRGIDITSKGYKIYFLNDARSKLYSDFPITIKEYFKQRIRYNENRLIIEHHYGNKLYFIKVIILSFISLFIVLTPIIIFINLILFLFGLLCVFYVYLVKIRKFIFFKITLNKVDYLKFNTLIFIKMIFYIYIEILSNIFSIFTLLNIKKKLVET